jgi:lipoic acid synthetase
MKALCIDLQLNTVCESAECPNQAECFSQRVASFLILGDICTRHCRFCAVKKGVPFSHDTEEAERVTLAVKILKLKHVVITSVTRDDLHDGGATDFARVVESIKYICPRTSIEILIPDFKDSIEGVRIVVHSLPTIIGHNVETVPRLYPQVRPEANYERSLNVLRMTKAVNQRIMTKSGLILGLGEQYDEVVNVMKDLRAIECDLLTIGQYLPPSNTSYPLSRYINPSEFEEYRHIGKRMGFLGVASGPFVRSSFNAIKMYKEATGIVTKNSLARHQS